jgi:hypothetical protein
MKGDNIFDRKDVVTSMHGIVGCGRLITDSRGLRMIKMIIYNGRESNAEIFTNV